MHVSPASHRNGDGKVDRIDHGQVSSRPDESGPGLHLKQPAGRELEGQAFLDPAQEVRVGHHPHPPMRSSCSVKGGFVGEVSHRRAHLESRAGGSSRQGERGGEPRGAPGNRARFS